MNEKVSEVKKNHSTSIFCQTTPFLTHFLLGRPMPSWFFWKEAFWAVILQILGWFFQNLQNSDTFAFLNQFIFDCVLYKIPQNNFLIYKFWVNSLWNLKFSYILTLYPLYMSLESWKKSQQIKLYFKSFLNGVWYRHSYNAVLLYRSIPSNVVFFNGNIK